MTTALIYVMLGLGLNIVVGLAGLLDLGYVAFYAVGAYSYALLNYHFGLGFWMILPVGALLGALFGILLGFPVLRLRGDYLAIVTLGFGEIIRLILENWNAFSFGPSGIANIPRPGLFGIRMTLSEATVYIYYVMIGLCLFTIFVVNRLQDSRIGRAWIALREDEVACQAMGIDKTRTKLTAFALGATWAGMVGVIFAAKTTFINPASFTFMESAMILSIVVLGGMGSIVGVIVGAFLLILTPEYLRAFTNYRMILFGTTMVLMMIFRPQGIVTNVRRVYRFKKAGEKTSNRCRRNMESVLSVNKLTMNFGGLQALDAVDLEVRQGEIAALIGPNGAGKTTFFNCITGIYEPTAGDVFILPPGGRRRRINGLKINHVTELGMARTFQNIRLFPNMTVLENVMIGRHCRANAGVLGAVLRGGRTRREEQEIVDRSYEILVKIGLADQVDDLAKNLPYGAQRRLEIARAMATDPFLLLLDEPAAGMNPRETDELEALLLRIRNEEKISILMIEHDMRMVMSLSNRIFVLDYGEKIAEGTAAEIRK